MAWPCLPITGSSEIRPTESKLGEARPSHRKDVALSADRIYEACLPLHGSAPFAVVIVRIPLIEDSPQDSVRPSLSADGYSATMPAGRTPLPTGGPATEGESAGTERPRGTQWGVLSVDPPEEVVERGPAEPGVEEPDPSTRRIPGRDHGPRSTASPRGSETPPCEKSPRNHHHKGLLYFSLTSSITLS